MSPMQMRKESTSDFQRGYKTSMASNKDLERFDKESERWDNKELGASEEHALPASEQQQQALDDATGLQLLSIRMPRTLIEQIKQLARLDGLGYQPYMRQVLIKHVRENEHKLERLLSPSESTEKADKLFAKAIKLKQEIPALKPLSNERVFAECDYHKALTESNALYCLVYEAADPVLKRHVKLRMSQIAELIDHDLQDDHDKKYGKKRQAG